jgi:hypothetical protein
VDRAGIVRERSAGLRCPYAFGSSLQQYYAQFTLKSFHRLRDRRLDEMQTLGGPRDATDFHDCRERPKIT